MIANPSFGFQVSAEGSGYIWSINSQENQITQGPTIPLATGPAKCSTFATKIAENSGVPRPCPFAKRLAYVARHGQGYSRFEHNSHGISLELPQFVPLEDSIKISRLKIQNLSRRPGDSRSPLTWNGSWGLPAAPGLVHRDRIDPETKAMLARNYRSNDFGSRVAFADHAGRQVAWTGDRTEFLGRNGTLDPQPHRERSRFPIASAPVSIPAALCKPESQAERGAEIVFLLGEAATGRTRSR